MISLVFVYILFWMQKKFVKVLTILSFLTVLPAGATPLECSPDTVRVSSVGDILIHKAPYQSIIGNKDGFYNLWAKIAGAFAGADISYGNLEGPTAMGITAGGVDKGDIGFVYDGSVYSGTNFVFNYHPRIISDLQRAGFNILGAANNHTMDRKSIGVDRTVDALRHYKMPYSGILKAGDSERKFWTVTSAKGLNIGWLACTEHLNGNLDKKKQVLSCGGSEVLEQIRSLRQDSSIQAIVVTPHWGEEYKHQPHSGQRALARAFAKAGASAIVGNHPHVLQSFEILKTEDGRSVPVAYSLGNFVSGQGAIAKNTSAVLYFDFRRTAGSEWSIVRVSALPTFRLPGPQYQVVPLQNMGTATEAWKIIGMTLKGVDVLKPGEVSNCR